MEGTALRLDGFQQHKGRFELCMTMVVETEADEIVRLESIKSEGPKYWFYGSLLESGRENEEDSPKEAIRVEETRRTWYK